MIRTALLALSLITVSVSLTACAGLAPGGAKPFGRSIDDASAAMAIKSRMLRDSARDYSDVKVEVEDGVALLRGRAPTEEDKIAAEAIAMSAPKVREVANEIMVADDSRGFVRTSQDQWLTTRIRFGLTSDQVVKGSNVDVSTYEGIVYLMGITGSEEEAVRAAEIASRTPGVKKVVSYLRPAGSLSRASVYATSGAPLEMSDPVYANMEVTDPSLDLLGGDPNAGGFATSGTLQPMPEPYVVPQPAPAAQASDKEEFPDGDMEEQLRRQQRGG